VEEEIEGQCDDGHCVKFIGLVDVEVGIGEGRKAELAHSDDEIDSQQAAHNHAHDQIGGVAFIRKHALVADLHSSTLLIDN